MVLGLKIIISFCTFTLKGQTISRQYNCFYACTIIKIFTAVRLVRHTCLSYIRIKVYIFLCIRIKVYIFLCIRIKVYIFLCNIIDYHENTKMSILCSSILSINEIAESYLSSKHEWSGHSKIISTSWYSREQELQKFLCRIFYRNIFRDSKIMSHSYIMFILSASSRNQMERWSNGYGVCLATFGSMVRTNVGKVHVS